MKSRLGSLLGLFAIGMVVIPIALGQLQLTWYVDDDDFGFVDYVNDNGGNPLTQGAPVYMMWAGPDGIVDGLNSLGYIQGDDQVVSLDLGGYAIATIGDIDMPFNTQDDGEFYWTDSIANAYLNETVYGVAFDGTITFQASEGRFLGSGWYGLSGSTFQPTGVPGDTWAAIGVGQSWGTDNQLLIPEPTTMALMAAGLAGIAAYRKRRTERS